MYHRHKLSDLMNKTVFVCIGLLCIFLCGENNYILYIGACELHGSNASSIMKFSRQANYHQGIYLLSYPSLKKVHHTVILLSTQSTDFLEQRDSSIFMISPKKKAVYSSETSISGYNTALCHNPEDQNVNTRGRVNLKIHVLKHSVIENLAN
jgi:hypothetical protein